MSRTFLGGRTYTAFATAAITTLTTVAMSGWSGPADAASASGVTERGGRCSSTTITAYGYRSSCEKGSIWDRLSSPNFNATYAIRGDRHVMMTTTTSGWQPISNGYADEVKSVDLESNGQQKICVEVLRNGSGYAYQAHTSIPSGSWSKFTRGCDF